MTADSPKGKDYWMDEISFLEARLNGSQGDIDSDDRQDCEEALKVAKTNLSAGTSWMGFLTESHDCLDREQAIALLVSLVASDANS